MAIKKNNNKSARIILIVFALVIVLLVSNVVYLGATGKHFVSGNDINPLAVSISKAKTTYLSQAITEKYFQVLLDLYSGMQVSQEEINELPQTIKYWFKEYMLEPLLKIKKSIEKNIKSYNNTVNYYIYIEKNKYMLLSPKLKN